MLRRRSVDGVMRILMARFLWGEVGGGEAGIEAAGGKPEHGGGDDDDAYGGHNASYITHPGRIDKGLELPVFPQSSRREDFVWRFRISFPVA